MADANAVRERWTALVSRLTEGAFLYNFYDQPVANLFMDARQWGTDALALLDERGATIAERDNEIERLNEWESIQNQRIRKLLGERDAVRAELSVAQADLAASAGILSRCVQILGCEHLGEVPAEVEALRADAMRADRGTPHKCPRCDGKGGWNDPSGSSVMGIWRACQTCMGSGVLWSRAAIAEQEKGK